MCLADAKKYRLCIKKELNKKQSQTVMTTLVAFKEEVKKSTTLTLGSLD